MTYAPFFKIGYAFSKANFVRMFNDFFWAGGIVSILILIGTIFYRVFFKKSLLRNRNLLFLLLMVLWQIFYYIFMVPRLGALQDIDLFFTVYLAFAFIAGLLCDEVVNQLSDERQQLLKLGVFSFFLGNASCLILYLAFVGVPYY